MKKHLWNLLIIGTILTGLILALPGEGRPTAAQAPANDPAAPHAAEAAAPQAQNVEFIGQIGGVINAVAVRGNYAYVGEGPRLTILDISDPSSPTVVGKTAPFPDFVYGIAVSGAYAYIADGYGGLRVVDVSTLSVPGEVGACDTPGYAKSVVLSPSGDYAYVADGYSGLRVVDVSDPAHPTERGSYDTPGSAYSVAVAEGYAYVADGSNGGLRVVDVSTPSAPSEVGAYDTPGGARGVAVALAGDYVYVADDEGGLRVVDVSTPSAPSEVGTYDTPGDAQGVAVAPTGDYAYVAAGSGGLRVVDVSTPSAPSEVGAYTAPGYARGVAVAPTGNYAYVAETGSLWMVDVSVPSTPSEVGTYDTLAYAQSVAVAPTGDYAYVAAGSSLRVVDVSTPPAPNEVGAYDTPGGAQGVAVAPAGNYVYVADGEAGLRVVDVSDPAQPTEVGHYDTPGGATDVAVAGGYAYVADGSTGGLRVADVSDPAQPTEVGSYDTPGSAVGAAVAPAGDYVYVADGYSGLRVVDVSTPSAPSEVGNYDTPGYANDVTITPAGDYIYVADGSEGLRVVDVSIPSAPTEIDTYSTPAYAQSVAVAPAGDYVYVTDLSGSLRVVNATTPSALVEVGDYDTLGEAYGVAVAGDYAYVADGKGGLLILRYTGAPCTQPLIGVSLNGPTSGETGETLTFSALPQPGDATTPITYTWSTDGLVGGQGTAQAAYRWDSTGSKNVQVTARNCGGQDFSDSQTVTIHEPAPPDGDAYEPDDTCTQAHDIPTDGAVQVHTFHDQADEDWVSFQASAAITYVIEARVPPTSTADMVLELYNACTGGSLGSQDYSFSPDVRLTFQPPSDGVYYLRLLNHDPSVYGPDVAYHLSVRTLESTAQPGALVLVAGRLRSSDPLQDNVHHVTNAAYRLFRAHGYPPERIYYLATDLSLDADGDGQSDVDALATQANLEYALTTWAVDKVGADRAFTLYLMDHGNHDKVYLDRPAGEWVTPGEIDGWLDTLEGAAAGVRVNVIVEACHAGSFIDPPEELCAPGRVVVASTGAWALAYASQEGAVFSDAFLDALDQGLSLYGAFEEGRWAVGQSHPDQTPWLDDDGDSIPNDPQDGQEAAQRGFAFAGTLPGEVWPPYIVQAEVRDLAADQGEIWAEVRDDEGVRWVWAVVYPPSWEPPETGEELGTEPLPVTLQARGGGWYGALYTTFDEMGTYQVVVYAEDEGGLRGRPQEIEVRTGWAVYLPLVVRGR